MLHSARRLRNSRVFSRDGSIGHVSDLYFDDERWIIRFIVVATGRWPFGRKVLIPPGCVCAQGIHSHDLLMNLTRAQVQASPDVHTPEPVSRQHEARHLQYYGYPAYWPGATTWAWGTSTANPPETVVRPAPAPINPEQDALESRDSHLRSFAEIAGYRVATGDHMIGRARDVLFEERSWATRFVVISTGPWWHREQMTIPADHIDTIDWAHRSIHLHPVPAHGREDRQTLAQD